MSNQNSVDGAEIESDFLVETGQIPCVIVYSDQKHVKYINPLIDDIKEILTEAGFEVSKLCNKTPPDEHFGEKFEKLAKDCILGIVILDGFRPNVLYEYGLLRGMGKIVLPIKDKTACIAIKSLYSIEDEKNAHEIKTKTGLTPAKFNLLKEPRIGYFRQLSDRHGINLIEVDCYADAESNNHPKQKIKKEIKKIMPQITMFYTKQSLKTVNNLTPELFSRFENLTLKVLQYFTKAIPYHDKDIEKTMEEVIKLEKESKIPLPSTVYGTMSFLYENLSKRYLLSDVSKSIDFYLKAIESNKSILTNEKDSQVCASTSFRIGKLYQNLSELTEMEINLEKSIKAYKEALKIYTKKDYPLKYAGIQNNLGANYGDLSEIRSKEINLRKSIKACEEALKIYTKKDYPIDYAMTQINLGVAYGPLSGLTNREGNLRKSIRALQEALKIYTKKDYPIGYAVTQNNLGNAYENLSKISGKEGNLRKSIKAYKEALKIRTKKDYPLKYAMTQNNLGIAYKNLSKISGKEENLEKSIKAFQEAKITSKKN